jgi:hypothetical protein
MEFILSDKNLLNRYELYDSKNNLKILEGNLAKAFAYSLG